MVQKTTPLPPETLETRCPTEREETEHRVLKGKVVRGGLGVEGTFECLECQTVHTGLVTFPAPLDIPFIISVDAEAEPAAVQLFEGDVVAVGDEFEIEESLIEVTGIELKDEARRVDRASAEEIHTLWGKNIDVIKVGFALNIGDVTRSFEAEFGPEDEIAIGDEFEYEDGDVVVDKLVTTEGKRFRGSFNVRDIKRVWLRRSGAPKPKRTPEGPRGQKEQRRASRERSKSGGPPRKGGSRPSGGGGPGGPRRGGGGGPGGPRRGGGGGPGGPRRGGGGGPGGPRRGGGGGGGRRPGSGPGRRPRS